MTEHILLSIAVILVLGVTSQWLAWRVGLPSILLLLTFGLIAGARGWLDPDEVFGDLLLPVVSISVALILYEGGLTLKFSELPAIGSAVRNLVTIGALLTWGLTATAAHLIFGLGANLSALLGAILLVTGPTVIAPMLRLIRPSGNVGPVLRWEGIVIDPIGAMLTVLVFETTMVGPAGDATRILSTGLARTILFGGGLGLAAAAILTLMLARYWIADYLQNAVSLMLVVVAFVVSDHFQPESGLLAATVMGIALANQKYVDVRHIVEFKENLQVLLISSLFIVLGARVRLGGDGAADLAVRGAIFVAVLVLIVRPVSAWVSTWRTGLTRAQRVFIAWMAPRGIVAAAVASVFALRLERAGQPGGTRLVQITFVTIIATVAIYGLTSPWLARRLKLAQTNPQGVLLVGAHAFARQVATLLKHEGFGVLLVDSNREHTRAARMAGLPAYTGGILDEHTLDELDLGGIGRLLAVTPNPWVNVLAVQRFARVFGKSQCFQLVTTGARAPRRKMDVHLLGRSLFSEEASYAELSRRMSRGFAVKATGITEAFDFDRYRREYGTSAVPLFLIEADGDLDVITPGRDIDPKPGQKIIALVPDQPPPNGAAVPKPPG